MDSKLIDTYYLLVDERCQDDKRKKFLSLFVLVLRLTGTILIPYGGNLFGNKANTENQS